jgi:hypothetical protein
VWPQLQVDGIVLVRRLSRGDDLGYRRFVEEIGVRGRYVLGMGLLS